MEILLVHRPRYDDWSLPKGKLHRGEDVKAGALREVEEETGLACELGREVAATTYTDSRGRRKEVRYFAMTARNGEFQPHDEVDDIRWLTPVDAHRILSYERDHQVLDAVRPDLFE